MEFILKQEKIKVLFICGLALDICVAETTKDAAKLNFFTAVITDCRLLFLIIYIFIKEFLNNVLVNELISY